jgi:hypothetical protein
VRRGARLWFCWGCARNLVRRKGGKGGMRDLPASRMVASNSSRVDSMRSQPSGILLHRATLLRQLIAAPRPPPHPPHPPRGAGPCEKGKPRPRASWPCQAPLGCTSALSCAGGTLSGATHKPSRGQQLPAACCCFWHGMVAAGVVWTTKSTIRYGRSRPLESNSQYE